MLEVKTDVQRNTATVTFDETRAKVEDMVAALEKGNYKVKGDPVYLK